MFTFLLYFVAQRIILSTLTKDQNGELFSVRRFTELAVILMVDLGLNSITIRRIAQNPSSAASEVTNASVIRITLWLLSFCVSIPLIMAFGHGYEIGVIWGCYLMISVRTGLLRTTFETPLRASVKLGFVNILSITEAVLFTVLIYLFRHDLNTYVIIVCSLLSAVPGFVVISLTQALKFVHPRFVSWPVIRSLLVNVWPLAIAAVLIVLQERLDVFFLEMFTDREQTGIYGAAYQVLNPITNVIPVMFSLAMSPVVARLAVSDPARRDKYTVAGLRLLIASGIVVCCVLSTASGLIVDLVTKGRYADNVLHFFTFIWAALPIFVVVYGQEMNTALSRQRLNILIALILAVMTIGPSMILVPVYAAYGGIVAKIIGVVAGAMTAGILLYRALDIAISKAFVMKCFLASSVAVGTAWFCLNSGLSAIFGVSLAFLISVMVVMGLRIIEVSELKLALRLLFSSRSS